MMSGAVKERMRALAGHRRLLRRLVRVAGRSESRVDEMVQPVYGPWLQQSPPIETTILASPGSIELHLSTQVTDEVQGAAAHERGGGGAAGAARARRRRRGRREPGAGGWRVAARARLADCLRRIVHRRVGHFAHDGCGRQFRLRRSQRRRLQQRRQDRSAWRAGGARGRARRGQRAGGAGDGGRHARQLAGAASPWRSPESQDRAAAATRSRSARSGSRLALAEPRETRAVVCRFLGGREMVKTFAAITAIDLVRRRLIDAPWDVDWIRR